jgi:hypothetical protein
MTGPAVNPVSSVCVSPMDPASTGKMVNVMVRRSDDGERHGGSDMTATVTGDGPVTRGQAARRALALPRASTTPGQVRLAEYR